MTRQLPPGMNETIAAEVEGRTPAPGSREDWEPHSVEFMTWLELAYRDGSKGNDRKFTKWNMEVAYRAGKESAAPAPVSQLRGEPRCGVVGWPPLKKAIWDQVIAANLNDGKYISAWELTDRLYAAALAATSAPEVSDNG
jgi:hypothetical protein